MAVKENEKYGITRVRTGRSINVCGGNKRKAKQSEEKELRRNK